MARHDLLPEASSTRLDRAISLGSDTYTTVEPNVTAMRGIKIVNPPMSFLPYLVYEYGLGELTPYVPNLYNLINEGIKWQRVRGTPAAVDRALSWLGYAGEIEEFPTRRRKWNLFQIELDRLRDDETDLIRIEGVTQLSVCVRSVFWRGYRGYDVRLLEYGYGRWGQKLWGSYSGVRLPPGQVKWSFGRRTGIDHALTDTELQALGIWLAPAGAALTWGAFKWPAAPWTSSAVVGRGVAMLEHLLELLAGRPAWAVFYDAADAVIGYRRVRAIHPVAPFFGFVTSSEGIYSVGGQRYALKPTGATLLYVEAMTNFGEGFGTVARKVGLILAGEPTSQHPVGALWLPPGGLASTDPVIALTDIDIEFGRTVRERVSVVLRF